MPQGIFVDGSSGVIVRDKSGVSHQIDNSLAIREAVASQGIHLPADLFRLRFIEDHKLFPWKAYGSHCSQMKWQCGRAPAVLPSGAAPG
jgi:hypothetical protein